MLLICGTVKESVAVTVNCVEANVALGFGSPVICPLELNFKPLGNAGLIVIVTVPLPPDAVTGVNETPSWPVTNATGNVTAGALRLVVSTGGGGAASINRSNVLETLC